MHWRDLAPLGVGLAADVAGSEPGIRAFLRGHHRVDYLNVSGLAMQLPRLKHYLRELVGQVPIVFHALTFNTALPSAEPEDVITGTRDTVGCLGARWVAQDIGVWLLNGVYQDALLLPPVLDRRSAKDVAAKVSSLQNMIGVPFLVENPPFITVAEDMHLLDYLSLVSNEADCGIVLDVGHLMIYQLATRRGLADMPTARFPFDRVVEVHLAGLEELASGTTRRLIDRHDLPIREECWSFLETFLPRMTQLKGLTLEQEYCARELARAHVRRARRLLRQ